MNSPFYFCHLVKAKQLAEKILEESKETGNGVYYLADYYLENENIDFCRMVIEELLNENSK